MHQRSREIELRAEINPNKLEQVEKKILDCFSLHSSDTRLSVLFLGMIDGVSFDIRIRINSAKYAEVVLKRGHFHGHDRVELAQEIRPDQFIGFVKIFDHFGFKSKVMQRKTKRFLLEIEKQEIALVEAGPLAYLEIEKIVTTDDPSIIKLEREKLEKRLSLLGLSSIGKEQFDDLCKRLTDKVDWIFAGSRGDYEKLERELEIFSR